MPKTSDTGLSVQYKPDIGEIIISLKKKVEGKDAVTLGSKTFRIAAFPDNIQAEIHTYGLSKVMQDRVSGIDMDSKLSAMEDVEVQMKDGKWKKDRVAGAPVVSVEIEALAIIKGLSIPDIQRSLKAYDKAGRETIYKNLKVVEQADALRKERAEAGVISLDEFTK